MRKVVFEGLSNKGNKIIIRYPTKDDAEQMRDYINALSKEQTFIRFQGEKVSLGRETKYLNSQLKRIAKKTNSFASCFLQQQTYWYFIN